MRLDTGPAWAPDLQKSRLYEGLLFDIILGDLPAGAVLEEQVLAHRYGGGLAGVRDALNRLALEGFVVRRARVGTTVAPLDLAEIEEAFEVRRLLEGRSAALAARNATPAEAKGLLDAFEGAEDAVARGDARALIGMDRLFHKRLAWATHNAVLARYLVVLQDVAMRFWVFAMREQPAAEQLADVAMHRDLARAVAAGDAAEAEAAMARLIGDPPSLSPHPARPALARA
jgi:DNA-binding GntR family transcriptional regulator